MHWLRIDDEDGPAWRVSLQLTIGWSESRQTYWMVLFDEANHAGSYQHPHVPDAFPRIQIIAVDDLLSGRRPKMPPTVLPYIQALKSTTPADQASLFDN